MTTFQLTEDNERFVTASLAEGLYASCDELFNDALRSLQQEHEWRRHVQEGTRQLRDGQYIEVDEAGLRVFFDDVKVRGAGACGGEDELEMNRREFHRQCPVMFSRWGSSLVAGLERLREPLGLPSQNLSPAPDTQPSS